MNQGKIITQPNDIFEAFKIDCLELQIKHWISHLVIMKCRGYALLWLTAQDGMVATAIRAAPVCSKFFTKCKCHLYAFLTLSQLSNMSFVQVARLLLLNEDSPNQVHKCSSCLKLNVDMLLNSYYPLSILATLYILDALPLILIASSISIFLKSNHG